jgi:hypothetical protein
MFYPPSCLTPRYAQVHLLLRKFRFSPVICYLGILVSLLLQLAIDFTSDPTLTKLNPVFCPFCSPPHSQIRNSSWNVAIMVIYQATTVGPVADYSGVRR